MIFKWEEVVFVAADFAEEISKLVASVSRRSSSYIPQILS